MFEKTRFGPFAKRRVSLVLVRRVYAMTITTEWEAVCEPRGGTVTVAVFNDGWGNSNNEKDTLSEVCSSYSFLLRDKYKPKLATGLQNVLVERECGVCCRERTLSLVYRAPRVTLSFSQTTQNAFRTVIEWTTFVIIEFLYLVTSIYFQGLSIINSFFSNLTKTTRSSSAWGTP